MQLQRWCPQNLIAFNTLKNCIIYFNILRINVPYILSLILSKSPIKNNISTHLNNIKHTPTKLTDFTVRDKEERDNKNH